MPIQKLLIVDIDILAIYLRLCGKFGVAGLRSATGPSSGIGGGGVDSVNRRLVLFCVAGS